MGAVTLHAQAPTAGALPGELPRAAYVHIPFCVRKCHYCDFAAGPAPEAIRAAYVCALADEIRLSPWRGARLSTLFFGGGTPSELKTPQLATILHALEETFDFVRPSLEATIECNPGTVSPASLAEMLELGFNRVSLGIQSFHDHHLRALGRIHDAVQARDAIRDARAAGFRRLNLDLIFGLPGQTLDEWRADVEEALAFQPEHLSLYHLTVEEETEFGRRRRAGLLTLPDDDLAADMYEWSLDRLRAGGWEQYEISNFARPGEECRHNQVYWRQEPFLGFGLGAASYLGGERRVRTRSMQRYLFTACRPEGPEVADSERLAPRDAAGEALMLALRTREGADPSRIGARWGVDVEAEFGAAFHSLAEDGLVARRGARIVLTRTGVLFANQVCARVL
jgi:oxygen-independent coproporphyrinogen-3 oxidase